MNQVLQRERSPAEILPAGPRASAAEAAAERHPSASTADLKASKLPCQPGDCRYTRHRAKFTDQRFLYYSPAR